MAIELLVPETQELKPRIIVFGVGGAGSNAVHNMVRSGLQGVEFIVANTDAQALSLSIAPRRLQLGISITEGLGAGARPDIGCAAAEEAIDDITENLRDAHMLFITAGMGGGTGTGAAPVVAKIAKDLGILTVGVVTKPFFFEGTRRMRVAEAGILELQKYVDTLIIIPNENLFRIVDKNTSFSEAFALADQVLHAGVSGITDLMVKPGLINLDFADVRTIMNEMGKAMMGTGEASGENRALEAAEAAISNPLLDEVSMKGAKGVLINITGGIDMTLYEVNEASDRIRGEVDVDCNIIVGSTFDDTLEGRVRVSVVATGIDTGGVPASAVHAANTAQIPAQQTVAAESARTSATSSGNKYGAIARQETDSPILEGVGGAASSASSVPYAHSYGSQQSNFGSLSHKAPPKKKRRSFLQRWLGGDEFDNSDYDDDGRNEEIFREDVFSSDRADKRNEKELAVVENGELPSFLKRKDR